MKLLSSAAALMFVVVASVSCAPAAEEAVVEETLTTESEVATFQQLVSEWTAAYNASDADAVAAFYADDAVWMDEGAPARTGKSAIRDSFAQLFELGTYESLDLVDEVIACSRDCLVARGNWTEVATLRGGGVQPRDAGKFIWLIRRQPDEGWKIVWGIWNRDAPVSQIE